MAIVKGTSHTIAYSCVEAGVAGNAQGFRGMSSGWAVDEVRRVAKLLKGLIGPGFHTIDLHTSWDGTTRLIIDNDNGYFDYVCKPCK